MIIIWVSIAVGTFCVAELVAVAIRWL